MEKITKDQILQVGVNGLSLEILDPDGQNITWGNKSSTCTSNVNGTFNVLHGLVDRPQDTRKPTPAARKLIKETQIKL